MGNVQHAYVAQSIDGGVYSRGPLGTTLPTEPVESQADLDAAMKDQGTAAKDGLSIGITRTSSDVEDFDGGTYIDVQTKFNGEFKIKLLDVDNTEVKKTAFGDANVTVIPASATTGARYHTAHNSDQLPIASHVFATRSGDKFKTWVIEKGRVAEIAEFKAESQDAMGLELTIKAFRNTNGNYVEEYGDIDGQPLVPSAWTVTLGAASAGTFSLTVGGQTTAGIAYNAAAAAVKSALELLSTVGAGNATVTGSGPYAVSLANGGSLTGSGTGLTGGSFSVTPA